MNLTLYPHQRDGVDWLAKRRHSLLFDEQGLGKTITAIAAADECAAHTTLVICPSVVLWNWAREFGLWSPDRRVQIVTTVNAAILAPLEVVIVTHRLLITPFIRAQLVERR